MSFFLSSGKRLVNAHFYTMERMILNRTKLNRMSRKFTSLPQFNSKLKFTISLKLSAPCITHIHTASGTCRVLPYRSRLCLCTDAITTIRAHIAPSFDYVFSGTVMYFGVTVILPFHVLILLSSSTSLE